MKNLHLDLKTLSTLSRVFQPQTLLLLGLFTILLFIPNPTLAEVFVPLHEYLGYFDSNGIYTVVGNVKNENNFAVIPTITVSVIDGSETISKTIKHVPLAVGSEIPFKIKFPEIKSNIPVLVNPELTFEKTIKDEIPIQVLYDKTLIKHDDGHITGKIQNTGNQTIYYPKLFAVVHGYDRVLDIVQNIEFIEKIEPGEILDFTMYPDPSITEDVFYYSCFGPVDMSVVPISVKKNEGKFDLRYDSPGTFFYDAKYDEQGTDLTIRSTNSYPFPTYANFEFPPISGNEKFSVTIDGKPIDFIQSMDQMGYWHVAFDMEPQSQGILEISGFDKGLPPDMPLVPMWIKQNGDWWSTGQIVDSEFLEGIKFLVDTQVIEIPTIEKSSQSDWKIPTWTKTVVGWWNEEQISDDEFLIIVKNLIEREIIVV